LRTDNERVREVLSVDQDGRVRSPGCPGLGRARGDRCGLSNAF